MLVGGQTGVDAMTIARVPLCIKLTALPRPQFTPRQFTNSHQQYRKRLNHTIARSSVDGNAKGGDGGLSSAFSQFIFHKGFKSPAATAQRVNPSPLLPPTAVLEQAMTMLQRNDWPEPDSGVQAAFNLTLPATEGPQVGAVRSWNATEEWLPWPRFHAQLHVSYNPLINCDSWRVMSPLVFPSERYDNKAVQAVEVRARPRSGPAGGAASSDGIPETTTALRSYIYTFCWERMESGVFKDCWLIAGVRVGNYAL